MNTLTKAKINEESTLFPDAVLTRNSAHIEDSQDGIKIS
jgi:hypothetical protein